MYLLLTLTLAVSAVVAKLDISSFPVEKKDLLNNLHKACVDQIGISEEQVGTLIGAVFKQDDKTSCYMKCLMSETGVMDENGEIDMTAFTELLPDNIKEHMKDIFESCAKEMSNVNNLCEKAFKILKCSYDADPESYFIV